MKQVYNKEYLDIASQVEKLKHKGLLFKNESMAYTTLKHIAYYRLSGYFHHFYTNDTKDRFMDNLYFEDIIELYGFDKKLRLLVLDAIETIEVSLRNAIILDIAKHNIFAFDDTDLFERNANNLESFKISRQKCWNRSTESFAQHFNEKYEKPPVWVEVETWSMGTIRDYITSVSPKHLNYITQHIGCIENKKLVRWIRCLAHIRNISAHHSRLWNRNLLSINIENKNYDFHKHMDTHRRTIHQYNTIHHTSIDINRKLYAYCVVIWHLLRSINPQSQWNIRLYQLIKKHFPKSMPCVSLINMGFPDDWHQNSYWKSEKSR